MNNNLSNYYRAQSNAKNCVRSIHTDYLSELINDWSIIYRHVSRLIWCNNYYISPTPCKKDGKTTWYGCHISVFISRHTTQLYKLIVSLRTLINSMIGVSSLFSNKTSDAKNELKNQRNTTPLRDTFRFWSDYAMSILPTAGLKNWWQFYTRIKSHRCDTKLVIMNFSASITV